MRVTAVGTEQEWANEPTQRNGRGSVFSCPLTLAGGMASVVLTIYGLFVVASAAF